MGAWICSRERLFSHLEYYGSKYTPNDNNQKWHICKWQFVMLYKICQDQQENLIVWKLLISSICSFFWKMIPNEMKLPLMTLV